MDVIYNGEHSVIFGSKHSWKDWHLAPTAKPFFPPPEPKISTIDVPGADGEIDLSTALVGRVLYKNRIGSFGFYMVDGYGNWDERYSEILNYLHGQTVDIILEDDPDWTYHGRCRVSCEVSADGSLPVIAIECDVSPYKTKGNLKSL